MLDTNCRPSWTQTASDQSTFAGDGQLFQ